MSSYKVCPGCIYCWSCYGKLCCSTGDCSENSPCLCLWEQAFFCKEKKALHLWSQMRRSVVLHRNWSVSLCLVVVRVPLVFFMWFSFSPPPVLREDQGGGMVTSWCNYAICLRPGIKIHCSCEAGTLLWLGGPGLLALMRSLTFSCLFFCSCFDSQRFVVAMACLTVWQAAVGNAASTGRRSELVRISWALPASFHPDRTYLPSSKGNANITILPDYFFFFS